MKPEQNDRYMATDDNSQLIFNTLRHRQNGRHFPDGIFRCIFFNENVRVSLKISLKFIRKVQVNNIPALVQIKAWRQPGDKPLPEPTMVRLLTHTCATQPQCVEENMLIQISPIVFLEDIKSALVQVMHWRRPGDKPLPEPMRTRSTDTYMGQQTSMS